LYLVIKHAVKILQSGLNCTGSLTIVSNPGHNGLLAGFKGILGSYFSAG